MTKHIREALQKATPTPWELWSRNEIVSSVNYEHVLWAEESSIGISDSNDLSLITNAPTWLTQLLDALDIANGALEDIVGTCGCFEPMGVYCYKCSIAKEAQAQIAEVLKGEESHEIKEVKENE
jgi:hypothetical protein